MVRLLKLFIVIVFVSSSASAAESDSLAEYQIHGKARMFMCPFLSPKFMDAVRRECSCEVIKSEDLVLHVHHAKILDEEKLLKIAEQIGYERKNISIQRIK